MGFFFFSHSLMNFLLLKREHFIYLSCTEFAKIIKAARTLFIFKVCKTPPTFSSVFAISLSTKVIVSYGLLFRGQR